ncbi:hypothetical protein ACGFZS_09695 [Streptomyces sp. NPDC048288]|uniref:hypothetical protein n=1 Tax=Streptomyces sp. NPDC048288 TaxID=3365529 RepID=UPI003716E5D2
MTNNHTRGNQEPEPVRTRFARLLRRPTPVTTPPQTGAARILRLTQDLTTALSDVARWKEHSEAFARDAESYERARDSAYRERAQLLAWLAALHPATTVITDSPDAGEDGWQLLYLVAGGWQMSWYISPADAELFRHVTVVDVTDERAQWDGHGSEQRDERIRSHTRLLALDVLGAGASVTGVVTAPQASRSEVLREAFEVAREEGKRLDYEGFTGKAAGARRVAFQLRRMITLGQPTTSEEATDTAGDLQEVRARYRSTVLHEVWEALRDAENGPLLDGMTVVNGLMEKAGAAEAEAHSA